MIALQVLQKSAMITSFVTVMMLVIEYADARWGGVLARQLKARGIRQLLLAAALGATPGCLGAFVIVSLFAQRRVSAGALVAAMIATSGDEAFVMFVLFPVEAAGLTGALVLLGVVAGWGTDWALGERADNLAPCCQFVQEHAKHCFPRSTVLETWKRPSLVRVAVSAGLALVIVMLAAGWFGLNTWNWKRVTLVFVVSLGLVIVVTVPEAFLCNHLVKHVLRRHVPRIFAWTAASLGAMALLESHLDVASFVSTNRFGVLGLAATLGLIPESGPHLLFATMYDQGTAPLSILFASSIVQDGHGMLPLLAQSRRWFFAIKGINLLVGLAVGALLLALGW